VGSNVQNPDIRPIFGKPARMPGQGLKKRTCPWKRGCMVTLDVDYTVTYFIAFVLPTCIRPILPVYYTTTYLVIILHL